MVDTMDEEGLVPTEDLSSWDLQPEDLTDQDGWVLPAVSSSSTTPPQTLPSLPVPVVGAQNMAQFDSDSDIEIPASGLDDDGYLLPNWAMDDTGIVDSLLALGLTGPRLALQQGDEEKLLTQLLQHLGVEISPEQFRWHRLRLKRSVRHAILSLPLSKRLRGDSLPYALEGIKIQDQFLEQEKSRARAELAVPVQFLIPAKGQRRRRMLAMASQLTKVELDAMESQKYVSQIVKLFEMSAAPIVAIAARTLNPAQIFRGALGDARTGTLRQYCRSLTSFQSWVATGSNLTWPETVSTVLEYIHVRTEEPCAPSIPQVFIKALAWFEKAGAFETDRRFGSHTLVQKTVDYSCEMLSAGIAPPKKAPRPPAALVAALEMYVCNGSKPEGKRAKAFQILVKIYGSLREDDVQNLAPSQFRYFAGVLVNTLKRTKTSGPTKRVKELPVCISAGLSITDLPWLDIGLSLLKSLGDEQRDHFLPNFTADWTAGKPGRLSYSNSAALGQRVLSEIKLPVFEEGLWKESKISLLPVIFTAAFTEHGPRAFMPTVLAELEVEKSQKDYVGRWSPTGSDDYTRSYRAVVKRLQHEAITAIKSLDPRLGEGDIIERLTLFGEQLEVQDLAGHLEKLSENLAAFRVSLKDSAEHGFELTEVEESLTVSHLAEIKKIDESVNLSAKKHLTRIPQARECKFLIIFSQGRRFARLHRADGTCPWAYTVVRDCEETNDPRPAQYNARCKICFPNADSDTSNSEEELS